MVRALCLHAASWRGLSSIARAVHSIGSDGPLPLVRWMSVRILSSLVEAADTVKSDSDLEEFLDIMAGLLPRTKDSFAPAAAEAEIACMHLLQRWEPTSGCATAQTPADLILSHLTDRHIPSFLLVLIPHVHDHDARAATFLMDLILKILKTKSHSSLAYEEDAPADALVEAILDNARRFPSPPAPPAHWDHIQLRLVDSLKYIAAVRFPIAIKQVLQPPMGEKARAIHAFCRDRGTLVLLVKELMTRMAASTTGDVAVAVEAMGMVLECADDGGVAGIAKKYFGEIFAALLVFSWEAGDVKRSLELVRSVVAGLWRAAGMGEVSQEVDWQNGIDVMYAAVDESWREKTITAIADFLRKVSMHNHSTGSVAVASQLVGRSAAVDAQFIDLFENMCKTSLVGEEIFAVRRLTFAIAGLRRIVARWTREQQESIEETSGHVKCLLTTLSGFVTHIDDPVALEAMLSLQDVLKLVQPDIDQFELMPILINRILAQMRRVIDHKNPTVRTAALDLLRATCEKLQPVQDMLPLSGDLIQPFYASVGDLWIPCLVRTQDPDPCTRISALKALLAIINSAFAETLIEVTDFEKDPINQYAAILDLTKAEVGECSHVHINACSYYLIGLSAIPNEVVSAAVTLLPAVISMIPDPSAEAIDCINDVIEKIFNFNNKAFAPLLAEIIIEGQRIDPNARAVIRSS